MVPLSLKKLNKGYATPQGGPTVETYAHRLTDQATANEDGLHLALEPRENQPPVVDDPETRTPSNRYGPDLIESKIRTRPGWVGRIGSTEERIALRVTVRFLGD